MKLKNYFNRRNTDNGKDKQSKGYHKEHDLNVKKENEPNDVPKGTNEISELKNVFVRLEKCDLYIIKGIALKSGRSVSSLLREVIKDYIESYMKKDPSIVIISKELFKKP